jgi:hypothetical protein
MLELRGLVEEGFPPEDREGKLETYHDILMKFCSGRLSKLELTSALDTLFGPSFGTVFARQYILNLGLHYAVS